MSHSTEPLWLSGSHPNTPSSDRSSSQPGDTAGPAVDSRVGASVGSARGRSAGSGPARGQVGAHGDSADARSVRTPAPTLAPADATARFREQFLRAAAPDVAKPTDAVVWVDADAELLLHPGRATLVCDDGLVLVSIPVFTEQTQEAEVVVPFAMSDSPASIGLVMATETRARGPEAIVDRWGEPLIASAWDALVGLAVDVAAPASPTGIWATADGLGVATDED